MKNMKDNHGFMPIIDAMAEKIAKKEPFKNGKTFGVDLFKKLADAWSPIVREDEGVSLTEFLGFDFAKEGEKAVAKLLEKKEKAKKPSGKKVKKKDEFEEMLEELIKQNDTDYNIAAKSPNRIQEIGERIEDRLQDYRDKYINLLSPKGVEQYEDAKQEAANFLDDEWLRAEGLIKQLKQKSPEEGEKAVAKLPEDIPDVFDDTPERISRWQSEAKDVVKNLKPIKNITFGKQTTILTADGKSFPTRYAVCELASIIPSNDPFSYTPNPDFPEVCQGRNYLEVQEQQKVERNARTFDHRFLLVDSPDGVNGTPIVSEEGIVISGNSRTMTLNQLSAKYNYQADYTAHLAVVAPMFGLKAGDIKKYDVPVLVRVIEIDMNNCMTYSNIFQKSTTQEMSTEQEALALSHQLEETGGALRIAQIFADSEFETMATLLNDREMAERVVRILEEAAIITDHNRIKYFDGEFTAFGKSMVQNLLVAVVLPDEKLMNNARNYVNKIIYSLPQFIEMRSLPNEWDLTANFHDALMRESQRRAAKAKTVQEFVNQRDVFNPDAQIPEKTRLLWLALANLGRNNFKKFIQSWIQRAKDSTSNLIFDAGESPLQVLQQMTRPHGLKGLSALPIETAKKYRKIWEKARDTQDTPIHILENYFRDELGTKWRHYIKIEDNVCTNSGSAYAAVKKALPEQYSIKYADYKKGYVFDNKNNRKTKLGKILQRLKLDDLLKKYNEDTCRSNKEKSKLAVVSRNPYDIAGMTSDRAWASSSCMSIPCEKVVTRAKDNNADVSMNSEGEHYQKVQYAVPTSLIAYETTSDDRNIRTPLARVLISGYANGKGGWAFKANPRSYGNASLGFKKAVDKFVDDLNKNIGASGEYHLPSEVYDDGQGKVLDIADNRKPTEEQQQKQLEEDNMLNEFAEMLEEIPDTLNGVDELQNEPDETPLSESSKLPEKPQYKLEILKDLLAPYDCNYHTVVWGEQSSGKSTFASLLGYDLSRNGKFAFVSTEEPDDRDVNHRFRRIGVDVESNKNIVTVHKKKWPDFIDYLNRTNAQFIVLDSMNDMEEIPSPKELNGNSPWKYLLYAYQNKFNFILIQRGCVGGKAAKGEKVAYEAHIEVKMEQTLDGELIGKVVKHRKGKTGITFKLRDYLPESASKTEVKTDPISDAKAILARANKKKSRFPNLEV
jgi:hypothetical protein